MILLKCKKPQTGSKLLKNIVNMFSHWYSIVNVAVPLAVPGPTFPVCVWI